MGVAARDVVSLVDLPRVPKVTMNTISPEEVVVFLDTARETPYYIFFSTLLFTGLKTW